MVPMKKGVRVWTCDGCGKRETWRKGWGYLQCVVSPANPGYPMSTCSDACEDVALRRAIDEPNPVQHRIKERRPDGWPLCPICEEDELYSLDAPATPETICGCYRCGPITVKP